MVKKKIYCGNNYNELKDGTKKLGSRNSCLKRGIGIGKNLPIDLNFANKYKPIDKTKYYCGNDKKLPEKYDVFGSLFKCHTIGIGVGKSLSAKEYLEKNKVKLNNKVKLKNKIKYKFNDNEDNNILLYIYVVSLFIFIFLFFYYKKPFFILKNNKLINWKKFFLYYILFLFIFLFIHLLLYLIFSSNK